MSDADAFGQLGSRIRFEWGSLGARAIGAGDAHVLTVVVDVLSFTTSVSVACDRGIEVFPFRWNDARAGAFATEQRAVLARARQTRDVQRRYQVGTDPSRSMNSRRLPTGSFA